MPTQPPETALVIPEQLDAIIKGTNVPPETALSIARTFAPMFEEADKAMDDAETVQVKDAACLTEMKRARTIRLTLKDIRVRAEKAKVAMKADIVSTGRAIDLVFGKLREGCETFEKHLLDQEELPARIEAQRQAALKAERAPQLAALGVNPDLYRLDLMPDADWQRLLASAQDDHDARIDAEKKAKADLLARQDADRKQAARLKAENDRIAAELKVAQEEQRRASADQERAKALLKREADERVAAAEEAAALAKADARRAELAQQAKDIQAQKEADAALAKAKAATEVKLAEFRRREEQAKLAAGELLAALGVVIEAIDGGTNDGDRVLLSLDKGNIALIRATYSKAGGA